MVAVAHSRYLPRSAFRASFARRLLTGPPLAVFTVRVVTTRASGLSYVSAALSVALETQEGERLFPLIGRRGSGLPTSTGR